jgi:hypothetical protein
MLGSRHHRSDNISAVSQEFTGYCDVDRHRLADVTPAPEQACERVFIPMIRHTEYTVESLEGKRLSAALHRFSTVLDMHYDTAKIERRKSTNAIVMGGCIPLGILDNFVILRGCG